MIKIAITDQRMLAAMRYAFNNAVLDMDQLNNRYSSMDDRAARIAIREAHDAMVIAVTKLNAITLEDIPT